MLNLLCGLGITGHGIFRLMQRSFIKNELMDNIKISITPMKNSYIYNIKLENNDMFSYSPSNIKRKRYSLLSHSITDMNNRAHDNYEWFKKMITLAKFISYSKGKNLNIGNNLIDKTIIMNINEEIKDLYLYGYNNSDNTIFNITRISDDKTFLCNKIAKDQTAFSLIELLLGLTISASILFSLLYKHKNYLIESFKEAHARVRYI